ncbi:MAG TPA: C25 family cysteine peptidase, partial [Vicinamibacteria bacterium]
VDQKIAREHVTLTAVSSSNQSDSVTATVILAAATRASLAGLRVDPAGVVELATVLQQRTMAFNLYETDDPSGRGVLHALTDAPVVTAFRDAGFPILYRAETAPLTRRYVVVEELEIGGGRRFMGPFPVGDPVLARALAREAARLDRVGVPAGSLRALTPASSRRLARRQAVDRRRTSAAAPGGRLSPGGSTASRRLPARGVRVDVAEEGLVEVPVATLLEHGLSPAPAGFLVWNQGGPVPSAVRPGTSGEPVLAFEARALSTDYTGRNAYLVTSGSRPYPLSVPLTRSAPAPTPGAVRVEKSVVYLAQAPLGTDPWLWDYLAPDWGEWPYSWWDPEAGTFDLPRLVPGTSGPVTLRIRLLGFSNDAHRFEARLNGQPVGEVTLDGQGVAILSGTVMAEALLAAGNRLTLTYSATDLSTGEPNGWASAYLDALELDLPVLGAPAPSSVVGLEPWDPALPPLDGVQYLVVTHRRFETSAHGVAALKEAEGLKAAVVVVDRAYDRFSGGLVEAEAVRALIRHARVASRGRLRYVLLVGDDTFDTHDYAGTGAVAFVPSLVAWDGEFGRVPSENGYADLDGDGAPDVAIGRLPVETVEQAEALVAKIAGQAEALAASAGRHLFVNDDSTEDDAPFRDQAAAAQATLPETSSVLPSADASAGAEAAREALRLGWEAGASVTHYFGHGGTTAWADEQLLSVDTVEAVAGGARPTVLLTWACLSQLYQYLWGPSINEALLLLPEGGALASFGPAGITSPAAQQPLIDAVYRHLRPGVALGEALRQAKREALAENPRSATVVEGFNLLGDPALRLP